MRLALVREPRQSGLGEEFDEVVRRSGQDVVRGHVQTLQVNVGKRCNQACHHCHVGAGPNRTEDMSERVAERVLELLGTSMHTQTLDLTGGAPELNANFRRLVSEATRLGRRVIDRCNLTVLLQPGQEETAEFLAEHEVHIVASLPCYQAENVEKQRSRGVFQASLEALRRLNALGYGRPGSRLCLDLVYNPGGAVLPPPQAALEARYKVELQNLFGIEFHRLLTITNMPIQRFAATLQASGEYDAYLGLLVNHFNPETVPGLMCRSLVSVGYDGRLHDCDFNQMLDIPVGAASKTGSWDIWRLRSLDGLRGQVIETGSHCFGCTAGSGSSCSGALR